jgi:uncharacterized protein DUF5662
VARLDPLARDPRRRACGGVRGGAAVNGFLLKGTNMSYDSRPDTYEHIHAVRQYMLYAVCELQRRMQEHDRSKLDSPEKEIFDEFTPKLKDSTYGSDEYKSFLVAMKPALDHHYATYPHHPEHYPNGIAGMSLIDLTEMLCDWKAATTRHANGDLAKSIEMNQKRFGYTDEMKSILFNTAEALHLL